ncbi:TIGR03619 family F420-dependent LLM class oxidoreductase [Sphaerisporangium fuscum]|uniref:TIGR03619 family F420-dependent LLM class oxidoreductase n=1 Tax=Sphaerisporangium fuscum TaxID=2835868 RepID=UPI001BDD494A|nr:TIGR03619 family F420-dependent LLM class oxidoreductase [Sphaerisporangium fuscum]
METGFGYFATHDALAPDALARLVEDRGHAALLFPEHTHIPTTGEPPRAEDGSLLPRKYWHTYDTLTTCMVAGAATTRLRVGTGICLVVQHHPIALAKTVASVDRLTGGRFEFGVGAGWNDPEIRDHGVDPRKRFGVMREHIAAMREIWTRDEAEYHGEHVSFGPLWSWPKPAQLPYPPILVGGTGPKVLDRVLSYGDVWLPNYGPGVLERIPELVSRAEEAGKRVRVYMLSVPADPRVIEECEKAGVSRVMAWLPSAGLARVEQAMDAFEKALDDVHGK